MVFKRAVMLFLILAALLDHERLVYANLSLRKGYHPPDSIIKLRQTVRRIDKE